MVGVALVLASGLARYAGHAAALRGPAVLPRLGGLSLLALVQLVIAVSMIYWLTRPSEPGANAYGRPAHG